MYTFQYLWVSQMVEKVTLVKTLNLVILQICSINTKAGAPKLCVKMVFLTVSQTSQENIYVGVFLSKN